MRKTIKARKLFDFSEVSQNLALAGVSVDWNGDAIVLFDEGRPAFPAAISANQEIADWYRTVPAAHHVVGYRDGELERYRFPNATGSILTSFAQPLDDGWLLVDGRGGTARVLSCEGQPVRSLNLGDAINHVQTTQNGQIWVGYFDEGVYGNGIGRNGLVCFDKDGSPLFKFAEFAATAELPYIDDCYALNVCTDKVWLSYYSAFPVVCLKDFQLDSYRPKGFSCDAFAVRRESFLYAHKNNIYSLSRGTGGLEEFEPIDERGIPISHFQNSAYRDFAKDPESLSYYKAFKSAARDDRFYLYTEQSLYELLS